MINNFSLLEKSIFPTLLFEKMRCEINFHENRIFFNILYFCTKYAILVNLIKRHKKTQLCQILIIIVGKYMIMDQYKGITLLTHFYPISNDYGSKAIVRVGHGYFALTELRILRSFLHLA